MDPFDLIEKIKQAFAEVEKPSSWNLANSREGTEPAALEREFSEVPSWDLLTSEFLDETPEGFGTALSFFSDEAYRYYLPAYLIASVSEELQRVDPVFYLTHGLDENSKEKLINRRRYGSRSWHDYAIFRNSVFSADQASVISAYLRYQLTKATITEAERKRTEEALHNYWVIRAV